MGVKSYISNRKHFKLAACNNTPSHTVLLVNYAEKPEKHIADSDTVSQKPER